VIGNPEVKPPIICSTCGADSMGCQVKLGLGGRRCCDKCGHDGDCLEHHGDDGAAYATAAHERSGVWAGVSREPRRRSTPTDKEEVA